MERELKATTQKVLLLLGAGLALGLSGSPANYFRILKAVGKEWEDINKRAIHRAIKRLYQTKLIDIKEEKDGVVTLKLNENGKEKILKYQIGNMKIPVMKKWDGKWRIVLFDIPESKKKIRDILRFHLKKLGFFEFQKSVFVHPFECKSEIEFLIEFYQIRRHVRFIIAESIDNELYLKRHFKLI
jgi:phenylacetic acid degradation operon negative regulatory protein